VAPDRAPPLPPPLFNPPLILNKIRVGPNFKRRANALMEKDLLPNPRGVKIKGYALTPGGLR